MVRVEVGGLEALRSCSRALGAGGFYAPSSQRPPLFSDVDILVVVEGDEHPLTGKTVNHVGAGFCLQLEAGPAVESLKGAVAQALAAATAGQPTRSSSNPAATGTTSASARNAQTRRAAAAVSRPRPRSSTPAAADRDGASASPAQTRRAAAAVSRPRLRSSTPAAADRDGASASDTPPHRQLSGLTSEERIALAATASRELRQRLIRSSDKRVHLSVVRNPECEDDEIAEYSAIAQLSRPALTWIAGQPHYLRCRRTLMNLVMNPMTPQGTALRLLRSLQARELQRICRSPRVRPAVKRAAKTRLD